MLQGERGVLVVRNEYSAALPAAGFGPDGSRNVQASDVAGRRPLGAMQLGAHALLVRFYQHGGLLRFLSGDRFLDAERPLRELWLAERLNAFGIPTPRLIAARMQRTLGVFWRLALVSERVSDARDLVRELSDLGAACEARPLMCSLGELVGRLHAVGLKHVDLHPGNILVQADWPSHPRPRLWILDLDRCSLRGELSERERWRMLARMARYALRRPQLAGLALGASNLMRFMQSYQAAMLASASGASAGLDWKREWRGVAGLLGATRGLHGLGWRLEEFFGAGAQTRQN